MEISKELNDWLNLNFVDNGHSLLSPSGYVGWAKCTGTMGELNKARKENKDNVASVDGTCGHIVLEICITAWKSPYEITIVDIPQKILDETYTWYKRIIDNKNNTQEVKQFAGKCFDQIFSCKITDEMKFEINKCYQRILSYRLDGWTILPEGKVSLEAYFGHKHCDGTSDVIIYKGSRVIIVDLKYGEGIEVDPFENGQAQLYAGGTCVKLWQEFGISVDRVTIVIMQPRINNGVWKVWETNYANLYKFLMETKELSIQALTVLSGKAPQVFVPSAKSCLFCHRKRNCKARLDDGLKVAQDAFAAVGLTEGVPAALPNGISNEVLSNIMDRIPFIKSLFNDIEEEAQRRARAGNVIPNFKTVKGRLSRKWKDKQENVLLKKFIAMGLAPDLCVETKVKSPAKMTKQTLTPDQKILVNDMISKTHGSNILVPATDNRPSVIIDAAEAFKQAGL